MDHAHEARAQLRNASVSPDYINDCAAEAQISALIGIGHALLALREDIADIRAVLDKRP